MEKKSCVLENLRATVYFGWQVIGFKSYLYRYFIFHFSVELKYSLAWLLGGVTLIDVVNIQELELQSGCVENTVT